MNAGAQGCQPGVRAAAFSESAFRLLSKDCGAPRGTRRAQTPLFADVVSPAADHVSDMCQTRQPETARGKAPVDVGLHQ